MLLWLSRYKEYVRAVLLPNAIADANSLNYWQNQLFFNFLLYCLPVSLIAFIPSELFTIEAGLYTIALVNVFNMVVLILVTLTRIVPIKAKKLLIISTSYLLSVVLINNLGSLGPGIFYMFATTALIALIFPIMYAYWSVAVNTLIFVAFTPVIYFKLFNCALIPEYTVNGWLAYSCNFAFLNILFVILIHKIFDSLQLTITNKDQLQKRYKSIFQSSPLPMWLFDVETLKFEDVNEAAVRHYGYPREEFLAMTIKDIRPPGSVEVVEKTVRVNALTGDVHNGNYEHIKKNGERIYLNIESSLLELDGRTLRLVLATDISEQLADQLEILNVNQKIRESEANLKAIFESTVNGFVLVDSALNIKFFNAKAQEYIRFSKTDKRFETGNNIFEYVERSKQYHFNNLIERVYKGEIIEFDRKHSNAETPVFWIRYTFTPVYEDNVIEGVCITGRDVTERKAYVKMIEEQNRTFHEISWMQSHLVRAPLARVMGLTSLLTQVTDERERADIIGYLAEASEELDGIVKNIIVKSSDIVEKYPVSSSPYSQQP